MQAAIPAVRKTTPVIATPVKVGRIIPGYRLKSRTVITGPPTTAAKQKGRISSLRPGAPSHHLTCGLAAGCLQIFRQQSAKACCSSYAGEPFSTVLRQLNLSPNQVWGLTKTDPEWSAELEAALTATRRGDLKHGTNAAYVAGCVCKDCREHQRQRMAKNP
jgi:hypothetical protein